MKEKKYILLAITLVIAGLMILSTASIPAEVSTATSTNNEQSKVIIKQIDARPIKISMNSLVVDPIYNYPLARADPVFNLAGDQTHPGFGRSGTTIFAAFHDQDLSDVIWTGSVDDGATWFDGVYYQIGADYPTIKVWDSSPRFFGTFTTNFNDLNGGATYIYEVNDVSNLPDNVLNPLQYWDWSTYGWSDMLDSDIACDNSQNTFEWGISSYVMSTTYTGYAYTDGNTIVYSDETTAGSGWISWFNGFDGSAHTDADIDLSNDNVFCAYDWLNPATTTWELLIRAIDDFTSIQTTTNDNLYEVTGTGNLQNPAIAAGNGNIVILAETDEAGNNDIICYYGPNMNSLFTSFVVNTGDPEIYPDVRYVEGDTFVCTYVKGGNLYTLKSEDAGATWIDESQVNSNAGAVVEEYKTSDLCEQAVKAMWEENGATDIDIWWGDTGAAPNQPPTTPTISGPVKLKPNKSYSYTFSSTDPEGSTVSYFVDWGDNTTTDWSTSATASHKWTTKAGFTIKVKARDTSLLESGWGTLDVSTPRINPAVFRFLDRFPILSRIIQTILG